MMLNNINVTTANLDENGNNRVTRSSASAVGSKNASFLRQSAFWLFKGHSRWSKVDDFGTNRKRVCDFLLVINSNFGPILHRYTVTPFPRYDDLLAKNCPFSYPSLIRRPGWGWL